MKNLRKFVKVCYIKEVLVSWLVFYMVLGMPVQFVMANPSPDSDALPGTGGVPGAVIDQLGISDISIVSNDMAVTQSANEAIINWDNFDIGSDASVTFTQPGAMAAVLNRVHDGEMTGIMGSLTANGRVFVINPAGILIGKCSSINVNQLVASSLELDDDDFLNGAPYQFINGETAGDVIFNAKAENVMAERLFLIGKYVRNKGGLVANEYAVMASGDTVTISEPDSSVMVEVDMGGLDPSEFEVENRDHHGDHVETKLEADHVILAAGDIWSQAICNVKTAEIYATGEIEDCDLDEITAYSGPGSDAVASVSITSGSNITIDDDVTATADGEGTADNAVATVSIEAGGDVTVIDDSSKGDDTTVAARAHDALLNNTAAVEVDAGGNVLVLGEDGGKAEVEALAMYGETNTASVDVVAGGDVEVKALCYDHPSEAEIMALAKNADISNTADVDIAAGGDVVVLSKDGGKAQIESIAKYADVSNSANINITTDDGYVLVHAIDGLDNRESFQPSEALIGATAEYAGNEEEIMDSSNSADITIAANDIADDEEECGGEKDGDVLVVAVNGGKAEVEAIAMNGDENTATVSVTADSDVKVIAECDDQPSGAEIMALAKGAHVSNTALVDITAGDNVEVLAEDGGKAEITAIAKDSPTNQADINVTAGGDVIVKAEGGDIDEWTETVHDSWNVKIKKLNPETWDVKVKLLTSETWDVKVRKWHSSYGYGGWWEFDWINNCPEHDPDPEDYGYSSSWQLANDWKDHKTYYDYDWINNCPEHSPNPADYGYSGWELAGDWKDHHNAYYSYDWINYCPEHNPNPADYGYPDWELAGYVTENTHDEYHSSFETPSVASIKAIAEDDLQSNTANVAINAGDDVKVMAFDGGVAEVIAATEDGDLNTSGVTINSNGDVKVLAIGSTETTDDGKTESEASIEAKAKDGLENIATIGINAVGGDVLVLGKKGGEAAVSALAKDAYSIDTNTADVTINATEVEYTEMVLVDEGDPENPDDDVYEEVPYTEGGDVKVIADKGGEAEIQALAKNGDTNNADILICIDGGVKVKGDRGGEAEIEALAINGYAANTASVGIGAKGENGIEVMADRGGEAGISSKAINGYMNTASTVACTQGGVEVMAQRGGDAEILALAKDGYITDAYTGVRANDDIVVKAGTEFLVGCDARIRAEADSGEGDGLTVVVLQEPDGEGDEFVPSTATAETVAYSIDGSVEVLAFNGGNAEISSGAYDAYHNDAYTGVCAQENIIVGSAFGGEAMIESEAEGFWVNQFIDGEDGIILEDPTTANAETVAYTKNGYVAVVDVTELEKPADSAGITSEAADAEVNTAYTGVAAGAELIGPVETASIPYGFELMLPGFDEEPLTGSVYVVGYGYNSDARIMSETYGGYENTSDTVICAPGETVVWGYDYQSKAKIKSIADYGILANTALTQVYSNAVYVDVDTLRFGNGIGAYGDGGWINIDNSTADDGYGSGYPSDGGWDWLNGDNPILFTGELEGSTLIINNYANRQDCPDCPPMPVCPCEGEEEELLAPVAPLPQFEIPRVEGCPALTQAAAAELGIAPETLQIGIGNALALNPSIQPCQTCESLVNAATILNDADGTQMAALAQIFNTLAPANAPFTPEVSASVTTAFADMADNPQYVLAGQYVDAFANYVAAINALEAPVGDPVEFALDKHVMGSTDNPNIASYLAAQAGGENL